MPVCLAWAQLIAIGWMAATPLAKRMTIICIDVLYVFIRGCPGACGWLGAAACHSFSATKAGRTMRMDYTVFDMRNI